MKILLTSLTISLLYMSAVFLFYFDKISDLDFRTFLLMFGHIFLRALICVCISHFVMKTFRIKGEPLTLLTQILLLIFIFNLVLFPFTIKNFKNLYSADPYLNFSSFTNYFNANMIESMVTATSFAILIPLMGRVIQKLLKKRTMSLISSSE